MLCEITIENVAVIEKATASFSSGFTALTGETGAGKSILIDSINMILGNRASRDIIRSGADKAKIWARFDKLANVTRKLLEQAGYEPEEELLLYREVSLDGKSQCRINGAPATAAMLRDICAELVNIHGQHDNHSLLNPANHLQVLDAYAQNRPLLEDYRHTYEELVSVRKAMQALEIDETEKVRKTELLRYELDEIEKAELAIGEEEELLERRNVVLNSQNILQLLQSSYLLLNGGEEDTGASVLLSGAAEQVEALATYLPEFAPTAEALRDMYYTAAEVASDIQSRLAEQEYGEDSIEFIEQRLDTIYRLKQRYGQSVEEILQYVDEAREQLSGFESSEERLRALQSQKAALRETATQKAAALTRARSQAFERMNEEIAGALAHLNMPGITFALQRDDIEFGPNGCDSIAFFISTNPGEVPKPLSKITSGGELARIMLAIKSVLADRDQLPTVIYDEIDTGVSGLAAGRIGEMMRKTAKGGRQVICVTHTAQIAAHADMHLLIDKQTDGVRTYTSIEELDAAGRVDELARIISGDKVTDIARANAKELLTLSQNQPT